MLGSCLGLVGIFLLTNALLIAFSLGIGWLLHWLIPAVELGVGALLGLFSLLGSVWLLFFVLPPAPDPEAPLLDLRPIDVIVPSRRRRRKQPPTP